MPLGRDVVIGLSQFPNFVYKVEGVPSVDFARNKVQDDTTEEDGCTYKRAPIIHGAAAAGLSPEVEPALNHNQMLSPSSR